METIKEMFGSNVAEIYKVSKQISNPFSSFLKKLEKLKTNEDNTASRKELESFVKIINSSKLSARMKERFITNMYIDAFNVLTDVNGKFSDRKVQELFGWRDNTYHNILRMSSK
jgi:Asp-tRNA(Asn)/Glu-tRNA(Gln) amidotransferase B subunit